MSGSAITTQITRLQTAKSDIRAKIISKGVEVDENATLSAYPALIDEIQSAQPTLFAPVITEYADSVSWENDAQNGGFTVTITATVDGAAVTSPLTLTPEMNGKTLTVTASAENFETSSATLALEFKNYKIAAGTYTFVNNIAIPGSENSTHDFSFMSGGKDFVKLVWSPTNEIAYIDPSGGYTWALDYGTWVGDYKTITTYTEQTVSAEFYIWFTANTTKN